MRALRIFVPLIFVCWAVAQDPAKPDDKEAVRAIVQRFADARNAHDGAAMTATYFSDGEYIGVDGSRESGIVELTKLWGSLKGKVQRSIQSVDMITPEVAAVRVIATHPPYEARLLETFVLIRDDAEWKIRVHRAVRLLDAP